MTFNIKAVIFYDFPMMQSKLIYFMKSLIADIGNLTTALWSSCFPCSRTIVILGRKVRVLVVIAFVFVFQFVFVFIPSRLEVALS